MNKIKRHVRAIYTLLENEYSIVESNGPDNSIFPKPLIRSKEIYDPDVCNRAIWYYNILCRLNKCHSFKSVTHPKLNMTMIKLCLAYGSPNYETVVIELLNVFTFNDFLNGLNIMYRLLGHHNRGLAC